MMKALLTKIILLLLFTASTATVVFSQNDSALIHLKKSAYAALKKGESDSARFYFKRVIRDYPNNPRAIGLSYNNLGAIDFKEGFTVRALGYFEKAINTYRNSKIDSLIAKSLYNAANTYKSIGQHEKSIKFLIEAESIFQKLEMAIYRAKTYNVLANIYKVNNDFEVALEFHNQAITVITKTGDSLIRSKYINNRGKTYLEMEYVDLALNDFYTALDFKIKSNEIESSAYTYFNIGEAEYIQNNIKEAELNFNHALNIHEQFKNDREVGFTINHLGDIAGNNNNWLKAILYFERAEKIAKRLEDYDLLLFNYESQSNFYENKKDFEKSLAYSRLHNELYQQTLDADKQETIKELQIKYDVEKIEQEVQLLAQKAEIDTLKITQQDSSIQFLTNSIIASLILIITVLLLGLWFYRLSKKAKKQAVLEKELAAKEKRFNTEQHHRIKNHLQLLAGLLSFQQRKLENIAAKEVIQESSNRVKAITTLHQHLYQSGDLSNTVIQLNTYLENLIGNLSLLFKQKAIKVIQELEPLKIDADKALPLGLICNEIITNAFKYGLTNSDQPRLHITLKKEQQKHILSISDNGSGIQDDVHSSSIGLELIDQMVKQMDAELNQENKSGTTYTLSF